MYFYVSDLLTHHFTQRPINANAITFNGGAMFFEKLVGKNKAGLWLLWVYSNKEGDPGSRGRTNHRKKMTILISVNTLVLFGVYGYRRME